MILHPGTQDRVISETTTGAGSTSREGSIQSDSLIATLWVDSVSSGNLTVEVYTLTDTGKEALLFSFPTIAAPSTSLLLKKAGISMQRFRVKATYTGVASYEVYVRAVEGIGEASVKLLGQAELSTSAATVTTTPSILIPSALTDRNGVTIKNYSGGGTLFVSESSGKLTSQAWPVTPGEVWSLDVASGVTIYAVSSAGSLDVRIAQAGG
jgi:hypothetical protein